nr:zinc finger, CCHC-type, retrotransposon Gag domain protein [Tanacetum cinerariifolium]
IREEFRTSFGPSNDGGHPPPVTIHTWLDRFNRQKPHSFEKATAPKLFFLPFFPRAEPERLKREYHSIRQTNTETSTEFMQQFLRLVGFLGAAAGTDEEQAKNFQWGLRRRRHPGECRLAAGTCFKCGQAGHLQKDCKKNTTASTSGQA